MLGKKEILTLAKASEQDDARRKLRSFFAGIFKFPYMKLAGPEMDRFIADYEASMRSLVTPADLVRAGGAFDACDLRHWLAIADRAGVAHIPAREIMSIDAATYNALSGPVKLGHLRSLPTIAARIGEFLKSIEGDEKSVFFRKLTDSSGVDAAAAENALERAAAALDAIPEGWMVRHSRCGPLSLKVLSATGLSGNEATAPSVRFDGDFEIGPGWFRRGNRRYVDLFDERTIGIAAVSNPSDENVFVARPWIRSGRMLEGTDPHTGQAGRWPAEWRVFVRNGEVEGVSAYYTHAHAPSGTEAHAALEAVDMARAMLDCAASMRAWPVFPDPGVVQGGRTPAMREILSEYEPEGVHCTLDFIETENGMTFIEGGPAFYPFTGGHPCGFIGLSRPSGVCLGLAPGLSFFEPSTWHVDRSSVVFTFEQAAQLAGAGPPIGGP